MTGALASSWWNALDLKLRELHANTVIQWVRCCSSTHYEMDDRPITVIAPHQDDETFGCGGLIAMKRRRGIPVYVIFLTDGARSHDDHAALRDDDLVHQRRGEALQAIDHLGVDRAHIHFLNYPDGQLCNLPSDRLEVLRADLARLLKSQKPGQVLVPHHRDFHDDHEATFRIVTSVLQERHETVDLLQYSIWMPWCMPLIWRLKPRYLADALRLRVNADAQQRKERAILAYRTQLAVLPRGFVQRFFSTEELYFPAQVSRESSVSK